MAFRKFFIILLLFFSIFPPSIDAQTQSKAGFVRGSIWYSKDPFSEGDKVSIYTAVFNPEDRELSGDIVFFDKTTFLDKKHFVAPARGIKDVSINWTVTSGSHRIFGKIENAKFKLANGTYEETYIAENRTEEDTRTIEKKIITEETKTPKNPNEETESQLAENTVVNKTIDALGEVAGSSVGLVKNIGAKVEDITPSYVARPVAYSANVIESFRQNVGTASENKKVGVRTQIEDIKKKETEAKENDATNKIVKPFKYVELFLLAVVSFIFKNKIVFYALSAIVVFLLLRYIIRKWRHES